MDAPVISDAQRQDLPAILALQKLCYQENAERYGDFSIPPLTQTLEELADEYEHSLILKMEAESVIIGSVRACERNGSVHIGRLIVHPDFQNRGLGKRLLKEIEHRFPRARRFELFTGERDEKNIHLYTSCGYRIFRRKPEAHLVFCEKHRT